jgi:hypothetical protein
LILTSASVNIELATPPNSASVASFDQVNTQVVVDAPVVARLVIAAGSLSIVKVVISVAIPAPYKL